MKKIVSLLLLLSGFLFSYSQQVVPLYKDSIPNSKPAANLEKTTVEKNGVVIVRDISIPALSIFLPPKNIANGTAVIICPGGGYWVNAIKHEGIDIANEFVKKGVAAFVLKYRIPDERTMVNTGIGPLQDIEQAMLFVRSHTKEWNIDTNRIGVMGFSAGGHLASTLGTHYKNIVIANPDNISLRPDFMILVYPVITTDTLINKRPLFEKLLGKGANEILMQEYSNEKRVTSETPPAFITQATDDEYSVRNSVVFYEALIKNKVKAELHLYQGGGHGYGLNNKTTKDKWMERCLNWMAGNGWLRKNSNQ
jgi:acetyl esterase/lipase